MYANDFIADEWIASASNYYNEFLSWFGGLDLTAQIITGALLILALVGIGYLIYGIFWVVFQIVKASIVFTIATIYISIGLLIISIEVILVIVDAEEKSTLRYHWEKLNYDVKYFFAKAYPTKNGIVLEKPRKAEPKKPEVIASMKPSGPIVIIKEHSQSTPEEIKKTEEKTEKQPELKEPEQKEPEPPKEEAIFCPNCGMEFSSRMVETLKGQSFTFCEACGEKFLSRNLQSAV